MRKIAILILLLVVVSVPVTAFSPRDSYLNTVVAIAWMEGDTLNVALGNDGNRTSTVIVSTDTLDSRGRPVFNSVRVTVPVRTILVENFYPAAPRRNEQLTVKISEGNRTVEVPVQQSDMMNPKSYIVQANTDWEITTDLAFLMDGPTRIRLAIDDFYQATGTRDRGPIHVTTFEGGLRYVRSNNSIEYVRPYMTLNMRTPQITDLASITFSLYKIDDGSRWRDEEIPGPTALVYGRNIRVSYGSGGSGRVPR